MMKRITIFRNEKGLVMVREHLAKNPPGNSHERQKRIKSGWQPSWIAEGKPSPLTPEMLAEMFNHDEEETEEVHYVDASFEEVQP